MKLENPDLGTLAAALRAAGLVVGVAELARCQRVLELWVKDAAGETGAGGKKLASLLARVVVKAPPEQAVFDRVFADWSESFVIGLPILPAGAPVAQPPAQQVKRFRWWWVALLALAGIAAWLAFWLKPGVETVGVQEWVPKETSQTMLSVGATVPGKERAVAQQGESAVYPPVPNVVPPPKPQVWLKVSLREERRWFYQPELVFGLLLLGLAGQLVYRNRKKPLLPPIELPPRVEGPTQVLLQPPKVELRVLGDDEREAIVWGVSRFVTEEKTAALHLPATVKATAKAAGRLELRYRPRSRHREIWLWLDESAAGGELKRAADEVEEALRRQHLPVERAMFWGSPEVLYGADGRRFRPREIEERRGEAQVAILSDGRLLGRRLEGLGREQRVLPVDSLFRELAGWPKLALFLPDEAPAALRELAASHQVEVRPPRELAAFLSTQRTPSQGGQDVELWAACCALSPVPVSPGMAESLARELELAVGTFQFDFLRKEAGEGPGGRLVWTGERRRERVEWLRGVEQAQKGKALYDRALAFWRRSYKDELEERRRDPAFGGTLAEAQLEVEEALLGMLERERPAVGAINTLWRYQQALATLRPYIENRLAELDTREGSDAGRLRLDFGWQELLPLEQHQMLVMSLGGRQRSSRLVLPGRQMVLVAGLVGLAFGSIGAGPWLVTEEIVVVEARPAGSVVGIEEKALELSDVLKLELEHSAYTWQVGRGARVALERGSGYRDSWGIPMVKVPTGTFWMGRKDDDSDDPVKAFQMPEGLFEDEQPAHQVSLSEFWMDEYEVTHEAFSRFRPAHQSHWQKRFGAKAASLLPVTDVDWQMAANFCAARGGRLPTEAEWEYAARAGTRTAWSSGNEEAGLADFAWYEKNAGLRVRPVGTRKPNAWGLYDLHGNVWEWTATEWHAYTSESEVYPRPSPSLLRPVVRGGSMLGVAGWLRSACRNGFSPEFRLRFLGFRCVLVARPVPGAFDFGPRQ